MFNLVKNSIIIIIIKILRKLRLTFIVRMLLIIPDRILFLSRRLDDNCLNNLLTSRTEPLKVNDAASHHGDCNMLKNTFQKST